MDSIYMKWLVFLARTKTKNALGVLLELIFNSIRVNVRSLVLNFSCFRPKNISTCIQEECTITRCSLTRHGDDTVHFQLPGASSFHLFVCALITKSAHLTHAEAHLSPHRAQTVAFFTHGSDWMTQLSRHEPYITFPTPTTGLLSSPNGATSRNLVSHRKYASRSYNVASCSVSSKVIMTSTPWQVPFRQVLYLRSLSLLTIGSVFGLVWFDLVCSQTKLLVGVEVLETVFFSLCVSVFHGSLLWS